eukprot:365891-Chlamydomonas_euryale.AAC.8
MHRHTCNTCRPTLYSPPITPTCPAGTLSGGSLKQHRPDLVRWLSEHLPTHTLFTPTCPAGTLTLSGVSRKQHRPDLVRWLPEHLPTHTLFTPTCPARTLSGVSGAAPPGTCQIGLAVKFLLPSAFTTRSSRELGAAHAARSI